MAAYLGRDMPVPRRLAPRAVASDMDRRVETASSVWCRFTTLATRPIVEGQQLKGRRARRATASASVLLLWLACGCGEEGLLPTTVDPGPDFNVSQVVFDEAFYYCQIEPMLFRRGCGSGDAAAGDPANGCHYNVTSYRLINYSPLVGDSCSGNSLAAGAMVPASARLNYQLTQARMKRDPEVAPLLLRATGQSTHPRTIFSEGDADADLIRQWANQFSSQ